jgi:hypothetical protein
MRRLHRRVAGAAVVADLTHGEADVRRAQVSPDWYQLKMM